MNASTLRISWDAASPDQNVTGYDVIVLKGNTSVSQVAVDNSTSSVVIPSLDQCDNYTVKVAANSSAGPGNYSTFPFVTRCGESLVLVHFLSCHNFRTPCLHSRESQCCSNTLSGLWSVNENSSRLLFKKTKKDTCRLLSACYSFESVLNESQFQAFYCLTSVLWFFFFTIAFKL